MVVVDGRGESAGITLPALSQLFHDLGCTAAYNLDGGKTSQLYFNGSVISTPENGGRKLADIVLIREPQPGDVLIEEVPEQEQQEQP